MKGILITGCIALASSMKMKGIIGQPQSQFYYNPTQMQLAPQQYPMTSGYSIYGSTPMYQQSLPQLANLLPYSPAQQYYVNDGTANQYYNTGMNNQVYVTPFSQPTPVGNLQGTLAVTNPLTTTTNTNVAQVYPTSTTNVAQVYPIGTSNLAQGYPSYYSMNSGNYYGGVSPITGLANTAFLSDYFS